MQTLLMKNRKKIKTIPLIIDPFSIVVEGNFEILVPGDLWVKSHTHFLLTKDLLLTEFEVRTVRLQYTI